ncbi:MAG: hypothetical protein IJ809_02905 [Clostridia bacterium]|nr:hypothetical protein [Clostridia bacterium]
MENRNKNSMDLILGILVIGAGLFFLLQQTDVTMSLGNFRFFGWGFNMPSGLIVVPLIIGVIMLVFNSKNTIGKVITALGVVIIVAAIIMSTSIRFRTTSMYNYVIMVILIAVGAGFILKYFFGGKK